MNKFGVRKSIVGIEERGSDGDCGRVIRRSSYIVDSDYCCFETRIVQRIILGITTYPDVWFCSGEASQVVKEIV
jgi:hypothetical protein